MDARKIKHTAKSRRKRKIEKKIMTIPVVSILFLAGSIPIIGGFFLGVEDDLEITSVTEIQSSDLTITLHEITSVELNELKQKVGVYEEKQDYNVVIEGYYTGLRPPTEEEWNQIEEGSFIEDVAFTEDLPSNIDHTKDPWFPPIGQQNAKSCVCWAVVYYVKTYQEAKEHGWDLSEAKWIGERNGYPSPAYQDKIMSPDFVYHQINKGGNYGTSFASAIEVIHQIGACSWKEMPQILKDYYSFPSESAWRESPLYRGGTGINYMNIDTDDGINKLKALLAGDELAVICIDADEYIYLSNDLWTVDNYHPYYSYSGGSAHANTIVGYDDNFGPYIEEGEVRYGAFKIANSWGEGFCMGDTDNDGCYWISYEAMKQQVEICRFFIDKNGYEPQLLATFQIDHQKRNDCDVTLGLEDIEKGLFYFSTAKTFSFFKTGERPFPNNKIVLDITEFIDRIPKIIDIIEEFNGTEVEIKRHDFLFEGYKFLLNVYDREEFWGSTAVGTLTRFSIEYYENYSSKVPIVTATSDDPPLKTVNDNKIVAEVIIPVSQVNLSTDKQTYSIGEDVKITIENNEDEPISFSTSRHWLIQKQRNNEWGAIFLGPSLQMITQIPPGEKKEYIWNQRDANNISVGHGKYRCIVRYSMDNLSFTRYAYFSIVIEGFFINREFDVFTDKSIYAPDEKVNITIWNIGDNTLPLENWSIEENTQSGVRDVIHESSNTYVNHTVSPDDIFPHENIQLDNTTASLVNWTVADNLNNPFTIQG